MDWYNFHSVHPDQLEVLVNAHIRRGYRLHYVSRNTSRAQVTFVRDIPDEEWAAKFAVVETRAREAQEARLAKNTPAPTPAAPPKAAATKKTK